ncbi:MAG TPA: tripartite tricarboxylate transporter substrate binding protein [Burkholderiales bacterium]|nr:tripartite tricarboxylate transporter substrate binding protein [Burkholderiales bacterium]
MKILTRILALALAAVALQAGAQNYPTRPVRAIIAFPAGSATDIVGRIISAKVSEIWGQQVVADNRGGAAGSIASAIAAKAAPDGYTLIINSNAHVVNPSMFAKLPYDTVKDFVDIMPLVAQPNVMVVNPGSRLRSFADFLSEARANPGKINFAFAGLGSGTHLNSEKLKLDAKIDFTLVSYKGSADAINDVLGGRVDTYFSPISAGLPFIQAGKLRALAITSAKRSSQLPNVPTIAESGVPGFEYRLWFGMWGPAGIPAPVLAKIRKDFGAALADSGMRERLATLGNDVIVMTPAEFSKFVRREIADTARIFKAAGIKPQ